MPTKEVNQLLAAAVAACEDKKAEDIRILALDPAESGLCDYFLICNGTNDRQNVAITDEIEIRLKRDFATFPNSVEGRRQGDWILMDYVDFIVHVFSAEKRAFYGLERLRKSATTHQHRPLSTPNSGKPPSQNYPSRGHQRRRRKHPSSVKALWPRPNPARKTRAAATNLSVGDEATTLRGSEGCEASRRPQRPAHQRRASAKREVPPNVHAKSPPQPRGPIL